MVWDWKTKPEHLMAESPGHEKQTLQADFKQAETHLKSVAIVRTPRKGTH